MRVKKKNIRSFERYFGFLPNDKPFRIAIQLSDLDESLFSKIGFEQPIGPGQKVLPSPVFGPISRFNALGKVFKRKDLPLETAYRTIEWHWQEWNGPYDRIPRSKFVDVPYKRYPRDFVAPPSEEIKVVKKKETLYFSSDELTKNGDNESRILHAANLFLEIFGEFKIVSKDLGSFYSPPERRLNWEILPPGKYPWERIRTKIEPLVNNIPASNQAWTWHRVKKLENFSPDFHATGAAGFRGYVVFGFERKNLYVFESIQYGNATYIFKENWKELSKLTKAEIIQSGSALHRIIHLRSWDTKVDEIMGKNE